MRAEAQRIADEFKSKARSAGRKYGLSGESDEDRAARVKRESIEEVMGAARRYGLDNDMATMRPEPTRRSRRRRGY